jgi:Bacteriophage head to tail connecting protein
MLSSKEKNNLLSRVKNASVFSYQKKEAYNTDVNQIKKCFDNAKSDLLQWRNLLKKAYHYALPNYNPFENVTCETSANISKGDNYNADIYDLTLSIAHEELVNKIVLMLTPPSQEWLQFLPGTSFGTHDSDQYKEALKYTQLFTGNWFKILNDSNFKLAFQETISDMLISTGILVCNEGTRSNPLIFESATPAKTYFEGGPKDEIIGVYREWPELEIKFIKQLWPNARLPENKKSTDKVNIIEASRIDVEAKDNKDKYQYVIMTKGKDILLDERASSWPWIIYRIRKLTGEIRGRGPTLMAWPSAATINEALQDELIAAAFIGNPMYVAASDSIYNSENFVASPGKIIPTDFQMGKPSLQQLIPSGNINYTALVVNDLRQQINSLMLSQPLGPVNAPDKTATSTRIRFQQNLENFIARVPRLQDELFVPLARRVSYVISKVRPEIFGNIPPEMLEKMININGELLDIRFETPIMTQQGETKVENLLRYFNYLSSVVGPEGAIASLNVTKIPNFIADKTNVDTNLIKSEEQLIKELNDAAQALIQERTGEVVNVQEQQG